MRHLHPSTARILPLQGRKAVAVLFSRAIVITSMEGLPEGFRTVVTTGYTSRTISPRRFASWYIPHL